MHETKFKVHSSFILLLMGLLCFWNAQAIAQAPEEPVPPATGLTDPPPFITELVDTTDLTPEQMEQMRSDDLGWGEILIATRLAERIAADSGGTLIFDDALTSVLESYAEGKDFGEIALEHDLKLGRVIGKGKASGAGNSAPPFIAGLIELTELTQAQVDQMRSDGLGWGNIMITTRLAERIAADSEGALMFDDALADVLNARAEDKGFGQIARENDLKLGRVVGNRYQVTAAVSNGPGEGGVGPNLNHERIRNQEKKQNIYRQLSGLLGFEMKGRPEKPLKIQKAEKPERLDKPERPEKPEKPEKLEKPEKPERPEKPEKPERPERPTKPEKPEKPERGPRR